MTENEQPMSGQKVHANVFTSAMKAIDLLMGGEEKQAFALLSGVQTPDLVSAFIVLEKLRYFIMGLLIHKHGSATTHVMLGSALFWEMSGFTQDAVADAAKKGEAKPEEPKPDA